MHGIHKISGIVRFGVFAGVWICRGLAALAGVPPWVAILIDGGLFVANYWLARAVYAATDPKDQINLVVWAPFPLAFMLCFTDVRAFLH